MTAVTEKMIEAAWKAFDDSEPLERRSVKMAAAITAALSVHAEPVAEGWQLVPKRLTAEMMEAACRGLDSTASMNAAYELALEAAPPAPAHPPVQVPVVKALPNDASMLIQRLANSLAVFTKHYETWMDKWRDDQQSSTFSRHTFGELRQARKLIEIAALSTQAADVKTEGWRPIETAPKDRSEILLFREDCGVMLGRWIAPCEFILDGDPCNDFAPEGDDEAWEEPDWFGADFVTGYRITNDGAPTHWMPLPASPQQGEKTDA